MGKTKPQTKMKYQNALFILFVLISSSLQTKMLETETVEDQVEEQVEDEHYMFGSDPASYGPQYETQPDYYQVPQVHYVPQQPVVVRNQIEICGATYFDRDVTGTVRQLFNNGRRSFSASNSVFGDPRRGTVKSLTIVFRRVNLLLELLLNVVDLSLLTKSILKN